MKNWDEMLAQLKSHPQTKGIYLQVFHEAQADEPQGDTLTIRVTDRAFDWAVRLREVVERIARGVYGRALAIEFKKAAPAAPAGASTIPSSLTKAGGLDHPRPAVINGMMDVIFHHGDIVGFAQHSRYLAQFVRAYIGTVPFDVWDYLRSIGKDGSRTWTRPAEITGIELARRVGVHEHRITGVKRNCATFDRAFLETGAPIRCCGKHQGARFAKTKPLDGWPEGRPVCSYRTRGALEILEAEGWLVYRRLGTQTKSVRYEIQIFLPVPLLTPMQAARLPKILQVRHREWIYSILKNQGLSAELWERVEAATYFALVGDPALVLLGLELPLPRRGVLSAFSNFQGLLRSSAHNHIFFDSYVSADEINVCAAGDGLGANIPDTGTQ